MATAELEVQLFEKIKRAFAVEINSNVGENMFLDIKKLVEHVFHEDDAPKVEANPADDGELWFLRVFGLTDYDQPDLKDQIFREFEDILGDCCPDCYPSAAAPDSEDGVDDLNSTDPLQEVTGEVGHIYYKDEDQGLAEVVTTNEKLLHRRKEALYELHAAQCLGWKLKDPAEFFQFLDECASDLKADDDDDDGGEEGKKITMHKYLMDRDRKFSWKWAKH